MSNDVEVSVKLSTDDTTVLDLGKIPPDQIVTVTIEPGENTYREMAKDMFGIDLAPEMEQQPTYGADEQPTR